MAAESNLLEKELEGKIPRPKDTTQKGRPQRTADGRN
jgi:hypothetical protein